MPQAVYDEAGCPANLIARLLHRCGTAAPPRPAGEDTWADNLIFPACLFTYLRQRMLNGMQQNGSLPPVFATDEDRTLTTDVAHPSPTPKPLLFAPTLRSDPYSAWSNNAETDTLHYRCQGCTPMATV